MQTGQGEVPVSERLSLEEVNEIIACPKCKSPIRLMERRDVVCSSCGEEYPWIAEETWEFFPSTYTESSDLWPAWQRLQENGLVSYKEDPDHNLGVGDRPDCLAFSRFCSFDGLVLDVGCGPQDWPSYFEYRTARSRFVGIDPLVQRSSLRYRQLRGLGEHLPFRDAVFGHVVFATTLDHFVEPVATLCEARRVCQASGEIAIWMGEKRKDAPRTTDSPAWYRALRKPDQAEDVFHLRRLPPAELERGIVDAGLVIVESEDRAVDAFRKDYFYRAKLG